MPIPNGISSKMIFRDPEYIFIRFRIIKIRKTILQTVTDEINTNYKRIIKHN